jgi:hypothetical protein
LGLKAGAIHANPESRATILLYQGMLREKVKEKTRGVLVKETRVKGILAGPVPGEAVAWGKRQSFAGRRWSGC